MVTSTGEHDLHGAALSPPRFTLRTLLMAMTLLCCLFALMSMIGVMASSMLALFLTLAAAHVLGNSLGTRLRDSVTSPHARDRRAGPIPNSPARPTLAAPRRLTERARLSRITPVMSVGGAIVGGVLGGIGLTAIYPQATLSAAALGIVSSAVIGAFAGFLTSSFLLVACQAVREALGESNDGS